MLTSNRANLNGIVQLLDLIITIWKIKSYVLFMIMIFSLFRQFNVFSIENLKISSNFGPLHNFVSTTFTHFLREKQWGWGCPSTRVTLSPCKQALRHECTMVMGGKPFNSVVCCLVRDLTLDDVSAEANQKPLIMVFPYSQSSPCGHPAIYNGRSDNTDSS